jgi:hypothetical protein
METEAIVWLIKVATGITSVVLGMFFGAMVISLGILIRTIYQMARERIH